MDSVAKILISHFCQFVLHGAEAGNGHAKCFALLGIFDTGGKNAFGCAHHRRPKLEPSDIENVEGNHVSAADFTQHVLNRHLHVVKIDGRRRAALDPHLVFLRAAGQSAKRALHNERRELLSPNLGEHDKHIRCAAVGNPHFLAVQDVMLAVSG